MNAEILVLVVCVEETIYLLLFNLHDCTFKTVYMSQVSAESNSLLMIKFKSSEILEVIIGISKGSYLSGS